MEGCPFCAIANRQAPVSMVYEDEDVMAFIPLHPVYPGACLVVPKAHIDHFTDMPDPLAAKIMVVANQVGRKIMSAYKPLRVGMLVHGFSVAHAHLHVVPQHNELDIMHKHYAYCDNGEVLFGPKDLPELDRADLDQMADTLRIGPKTRFAPSPSIYDEVNDDGCEVLTEFLEGL